MAQLAGRQLAIADHGVSTGGLDNLTQLQHLARAEVGGGIWIITSLDHAIDNLGASCLGEQCEFAQRTLSIENRSGGPDTREHDPLKPNLAVFDLGDILEFG